MSKGDFGYGSTVREYRDSPSPGPGGSSGFGGGYQGAGSGGGSFHQVVDEIRSNVFTINNNATTIERATRQIGSSTDSIQLRDKIHSTEQSTNEVITSTKRALKQLGSLCSKNNNRSEKVQYERLHCEFKASCEKYVKLQRDAADKVRSTPALKQGQQKSRSDLINWGDTVDDEERLLEHERRRDQMQAQQELVEGEVAMLQEREDRIRQLESDILDINEIFRDLGTFVHEQGEVIDTIEANVENAYDHVEAGQQELIKASRYQRKARKKKCILVIILLVILVIIALIIYLSVRK